MKSLAKEMIFLGTGELIRYLLSEDIDDVTIGECIEKYRLEVQKRISIFDRDKNMFYPIKRLSIEMNTSRPNNGDGRSIDVIMSLLSSTKEKLSNFETFYDNIKDYIEQVFDNESLFVIKTLYEDNELDSMAKAVIYKLYLADTLFDILMDFRLLYNGDYDDMLDTLCYTTWMSHLLNSAEYGLIETNNNEMIYIKPRVWIKDDIVNIRCSMATCNKR